MKRFCILAAVLLAFTATACTTPVQTDYPLYLAKNAGEVTFPRVTKSASYYIDKKTQKHRQNIRSFGAGIANKWVVEFGPMLVATMQSDDVKAAIAKVTRVSSPKRAKGLLILFSLQSYRFADFRATLDLEITVRKGNREVLSKTYHAVGKGQGGKVFLGGAFAMKNAVQQSTKFAIDEILTQFFRDMKNAI